MVVVPPPPPPLQDRTPTRRRRTRLRRIMIGDEVRVMPTAAAGMSEVGMRDGNGDEVDGLMQELDEVLDMVCVWGDVGEGLGALGDLFECFAVALGEM